MYDILLAVLDLLKRRDSVYTVIIDVTIICYVFHIYEAVVHIHKENTGQKQSTRILVSQHSSNPDLINQSVSDKT